MSEPIEEENRTRWVIYKRDPGGKPDLARRTCYSTDEVNRWLNTRVPLTDLDKYYVKQVGGDVV